MLPGDSCPPLASENAAAMKQIVAVVKPYLAEKVLEVVRRQGDAGRSVIFYLSLEHPFAKTE